jgi:hypothetical protein
MSQGGSGNLSSFGRTESAESTASEVKASLHGESFCRFHPLPDMNAVMNRTGTHRRIAGPIRNEVNKPINMLRDFSDHSGEEKKAKIIIPSGKSHTPFVVTEIPNPSKSNIFTSASLKPSETTQVVALTPIRHRKKCFSWLCS